MLISGTLRRILFDAMKETREEDIIKSIEILIEILKEMKNECMVQETKTIICKHCEIEFQEENAKLEKKGQHIKASCPICGRYIKFVSQGGEYTFYVGKHKGKTLREVVSEDYDYVIWCLENWDKKKIDKLQEALDNLK